MKRTFSTLFFGCLLASLTPACGEAELPDSDVEAIDEAPQALDEAPEAIEQAAANGHGKPAKTYLLPPNAKFQGRTQGEWGAEWWQWLLSTPWSTSPARDGDCTQNQDGKVFFLAGNFGGVSQRECSVPQGKAIFFPIINHVCLQCPELSCNYSSASLAACAATGAGNQVPTLLEIDGHPVEDLEDRRAPTGLFEDTQSSNPDRHFSTCGGPIRQNACGIPEGTTRDIASEGYWVMLHPLPPGEHTIHFAGRNVVSGFSADITYTINVEE